MWLVFWWPVPALDIEQGLLFAIWLSLPVMGQVCSLVVGVEAFRSISEPWFWAAVWGRWICNAPPGRGAAEYSSARLLTSDGALLCYLTRILQAYEVHHGWHCPWPRLIFGNAGNELWYLSDIVFTRPPAEIHWSQVHELQKLCTWTC